MRNPLITLKDVSYTYPQSGVLALRNINLEIGAGEFLAVMGENGSGKTTLCRLLNGIIPHSQGGTLRGGVSVGGIPTADSSVPELARIVGMVLDDPETQLFAATVRAEAASGPENLMLPVDEIKKRSGFALRAVGLYEYGDTPPFALSGGQKQRLAIAAALALIGNLACKDNLAHAGKTLVLDEPASWLDNAGARELLSLVRFLREKSGLTVVMTTHNSEEAALFADRVCVLKNGEIAACGFPEAVLGDTSLLENCRLRPPRCVGPGLPFVQTDSFFSSASGSAPADAIQDAIKIEGLNFSRVPRQPILRNINLRVADNEFVVIAGQNGSGKSTLLKCVTGLLPPDSGKIFIRGKNTRRLTAAEISRLAGFVTQNPDSQLFADTVYNEAAFALKNSRMDEREIQSRVEAALAELGLENRRDAFPPALSRADRAKVVIASVLAMESKIIFLDEPDAGQDYRCCRMIMDIAKKLHNKGYTIIVITHNIFLAAQYSGRLVIMDSGEIAADGDTGAVLRDTETLERLRIIPPRKGLGKNAW